MQHNNLYVAFTVPLPNGEFWNPIGKTAIENKTISPLELLKAYNERFEVQKTIEELNWSMEPSDSKSYKASQEKFCVQNPVQTFAFA